MSTMTRVKLTSFRNSAVRGPDAAVSTLSPAQRNEMTSALFLHHADGREQHGRHQLGLKAERAVWIGVSCLLR